MLNRCRAFMLVVVAVMIASAVVTTEPSLAGSAAKYQSSPSLIVPAGLIETVRGSRTIEEIAAGFPSPTEAASLMTSWGWQGNAYFNYSGATANGTTSLEVSFHLFGTTTGATEAMSYFAAGRALMTGLSPVPFARVGDELLAIGGTRDGVNEVTIYLRQGAFLIRISAVAPNGDPGPDAVATAQGVLLQLSGSSVQQKARTVEELLPTLADMPLGFVVSEEGNRSQTEIANTFLRPVEAGAFLSTWGFQGNVYRYFVLPTGVVSYIGGATSIEVSLHLFDAPAGAYDALPYYAQGRAEALGIQLVGSFDIGDGAIMLQGPAPTGSGVEVTIYMLLSNVLVRVSAVSPNGDPTADALVMAVAVAAKA